MLTPKLARSLFPGLGLRPIPSNFELHLPPQPLPYPQLAFLPSFSLPCPLLYTPFHLRPRPRPRRCPRLRPSPFFLSSPVSSPLSFLFSIPLALFPVVSLRALYRYGGLWRCLWLGVWVAVLRWDGDGEKEGSAGAARRSSMKTDETPLNHYTIELLKPLADVDPILLSDYAATLLKIDKPKKESQTFCVDQLCGFLGGGQLMACS